MFFSNIKNNIIKIIDNNSAINIYGFSNPVCWALIRALKNNVVPKNWSIAPVLSIFSEDFLLLGRNFVFKKITIRPIGIFIKI